MRRFLTDLAEPFRRGNACVRLIWINGGVFVAATLLSVLLQLFNIDTRGLWTQLSLPASLPAFVQRPWTLLTYMFVHMKLLHIVFNMLWLYWFGQLFLYFFSTRHLRALYLLGGLCGGGLYVLAYNLFPYFANAVHHSMAMGASASVLAIVTATTYREPDYRIRLLLLGSVRLKYLALAVVLIDLLSVTSANAGGHIAHLGGALAGVWFAAGLARGRDITAWLNRLTDGCIALFRRETWRPKPRMKVHRHTGGKTKREQEYDYNARRKAQADETDRILEKLKKSGYGSLTEEEKKSLFDASKR